MGEWLHSLVPWGTEVIVGAQSFRSDFLDIIFTGVTILGEEFFYFLFLPMIYWCINKPLGIRMSYLLIFSNYINSFVKVAFRIPRPDDPRLLALRHETSYSFPSGHAQNATTLWGYLALKLKVLPARLILVILILLIGVSRIYLGVHYPQDMVGGFLVGILVLAVFVWVGEYRILPWIRQQTFSVRLVLGIVAPAALLLLIPRDHLGLYPAEGAATTAGTLLGLNIGLLFEGRFVRFTVAGHWTRRLLRFLVGAILVIVFYLAPRLVIPEVDSATMAALLRVIRYALVGFVLVYGAPWLFLRIGLAGREQPVSL